MEGFDPHTITQNILTNGANRADVREPRVYQSIEYIPELYVTQPWNWGRASSTILRGGTGGNPGTIRSTLSPRYAFRGGNYNFVGGMDKHAYSPFQAARLLENNKKIAGKMAGLGVESNTGTTVSTGFMGRLTAASRLGMFDGSGAANLSYKASSRVNNFLAAQHAANAKLGFSGAAPALSVGSTAADAGQGILATQQGSFNRFMGGFVSGSTRNVSTFAINAEKNMLGLADGKVGHFAKGAQIGARWAGYGGQTGTLLNGGLRTAYHFGASKAGGTGAQGAFGAGAKTAAKFGVSRASVGLSAASKFAGPVGWAMLAYDLTRLAGQGVAAAADLGRDAFTSLKGQIDKPAFGGGFRDSTVAATSRSRGVMAIQNSRLNARSVLGSEASMLASHFG